MRQKDQKKLKHGGRKHLPLPLGPYPVGCVDLMTGQDITGSFMRIYYPAAPQGDALDKQLQWPSWLPHDKYLNGYASFLGIWKPLFKAMYHVITGDVLIPAVWDAPPAQPTTNKFPVIVYSHGLATCRTSYTTICMELASHGNIVCAVEHRDGSASHTYYMTSALNGPTVENDYIEFETSSQENEYNYPEGWDREESILHMTEIERKWVYYQKLSLKEKAYPERNKQLHIRRTECQKALDILTALNEGKPVTNIMDSLFKASGFQGIMDLDRVAIAGHSFGGATTFETLAFDKRFKLGLALDPWMVPLLNDDDMLKNITQPILFVNMEKFQTKTNLRHLSKLEGNNSVERKFITVRNAVHLDQCDMPFICGPITYKFLSGFSWVNPLTVTDITSCLMLEFLSKHFSLNVESDWEKYLSKQGKKLKQGINPKLKTPLEINK